jgi:glycosyltransferase involved in cell wall biosynthesis
VVPPVFRRTDYATRVTGAMVTFINPVAVKGVDLALQIAALCPQIPFAFVRGWPLGVTQEARLKRKIRRLGNVVLLDRRTDMRTIYRDTRILLVPSQWEDETWGRVVSEAQFSGIPVVASDRGGLPEVVGPGGLILGHDAPAALWAEAVTRLWSDPPHYARLSQAALAHSTRSDLDPEKQVSTLIHTLQRFLSAPPGTTGWQ